MFWLTLTVGMEEGREAPCTVSDSTEVLRKQFARSMLTLIYLRIYPPLRKLHHCRFFTSLESFGCQVKEVAEN